MPTRGEVVALLGRLGHSGFIGGETTSTAFHPMTEYATPADFAKWEAHAKTLDLYALRHTIIDCQEAEEAMRGHNPVKEGYYSDQASTYGMEYTRRTRQS